MLVKECLAELGQDSGIQVFATDLDADAIERGRRGIYPEGISADVSAERLHSFFLRVGDTFLINKEIREIVVFAVHDLIKDPPFSKVDLICCRNLLIYLNADLQSRLLPLLYYSLNPQGILFLGTAEAPGKHSDLFSTLDNKWKIYQRRAGAYPNHQLAQMGSVLTHSERREAVGQNGPGRELLSGPLKMNFLNLDREGLRQELDLAMRTAFLKGQEFGRGNYSVWK
jgi:two-component system CheB/CheR fusion protein